MPEPKKKIVDGVTFPAGSGDYHCQLFLFRHAPKLIVDPTWRPTGKPGSPYHGTGRYSHCRRLIEMSIPSFEWHDFSERQIRALCEHSANAWCGSGGSGKSAATAAYAKIWYAAGIEESAVLIASTTISAALQRIWRNVSSNFSEMKARTAGITFTGMNFPPLGEMVILGKPRPEIRAKPKDFGHGIFVIPVAQGDVQKAIDELKGRHPKRLLLIGDETDSISQAIVEVQDNLRIGTDEFQTIWLGNLPSMFNPLGKLMEPALNTPVSEACGMEWTSSTGVHCLRFDGEDSPNIRDNGKWRGLMKQQDIDEILRRNHGVKGQQYWIMVKGLPPPEGVDDTVLSEATLNRFHARDPVTWAREYITSASLDPGFGGDPCMLRFFQRGIDKDGSLKLLHAEAVAIPVDASDPSNPAEYQIAEKVVALCKARSVDPIEFIIGSTGIGRGTATVLQRTWSASIELCEEGGATTILPVSAEDPRPANEVYDRLVTELWFSIREFVQADMIRGMDTQTGLELCSRKWEYKGSGAGKRISIEKKDDMRLRGVPSPNNGDCLGFYCCLLRRKGINAASTGVTSASSVALQNEAESYDFDEGYGQA